MITVYENKEAGGARVKLDRRVYQTAAGDLVEEGHPEAATLYGSVGKEVPRAEFEALGGVVKGQAKPKPAPVAADKPKPAPKAKATPKPKATKKGK